MGLLLMSQEQDKKQEKDKKMTAAAGFYRQSPPEAISTLLDRISAFQRPIREGRTSSTREPSHTFGMRAAANSVGAQNRQAHRAFIHAQQEADKTGTMHQHAHNVGAGSTNPTITAGEAADPKEPAKPAAKSVPGYRLLPQDFSPSPYSVVFGLRKDSPEHNVGNRRLQLLVSDLLPQYENAINRASMSKIVSAVVSTVKQACANQAAGEATEAAAFVKWSRKERRWYEVSEAAAREKVGYTFRTMLKEQRRANSEKSDMEHTNQMNKQEGQLFFRSEEPGAMKQRPEDLRQRTMEPMSAGASPYLKESGISVNAGSLAKLSSPVEAVMPPFFPAAGGPGSLFGRQTTTIDPSSLPASKSDFGDERDEDTIGTNSSSGSSSATTGTADMTGPSAVAAALDTARLPHHQGDTATEVFPDDVLDSLLGLSPHGYHSDEEDDDAMLFD